MSRLSKQVRENMANDLLLLKFEERGEILADRSAELFDIVYESRYDLGTRRLMASLKKKFQDAFSHWGTIDCLAPGGLRISVGRAQFGHGKIKFRASVVNRPFLPNDRHNGAWRFDQCNIGQQLEQFAADQMALVDDIKAAEHELLGALSGVTTAKQLSELWPEAMPILGKHIPIPSGSNLPAVQFAKLTSEFGLTDGGDA